MRFLGLLACLLATAAPAAPPDTLVICSRDLQPELAPWLAHRQGQGHVIAVIEPAVTFAEQRAAVQDANATGTLKNLLIVGDGAGRTNVVPVEYAEAKINVQYGSEPELATDFGLSDLNGDQQPDLCVGRLPVRTHKELAQVIDKIIAYENDRRGADWRRRINLVAGTGRFSLLADKMIETTAGRLISEMVPADREVYFTYGSWRSPFCPPPRQFSRHTLARLNEGCCMWVYVGHGQPHELDHVYCKEGQFPILARNDLAQLNCQTGQPIAVMLACYTGAFDGYQPSVAEQFLLQPGGPVAVLAASRVSMPYGNTVLGTELMRAMFAEKATTLGEVVRQAKSRLMERESNDPHRKLVESLASLYAPKQADRDQERWEHSQMYNLLGDPLLRIDHPADLQLAATNSTTTGKSIRITGYAPQSGKLRCEWTLPNERRLANGIVRRELPLDAAAEKAQTEQYEAANQTVLATATIDVRSGRFDAELDVPELPPGRYVLRALMAEKDSWASSAAMIEIAGARTADGDSGHLLK